MSDLVAYKRMPIWTKETVPTEITHKHNTKVGTWGKIKVLSGELKYEAISNDNEITATYHYRATDDIPMVEPQAWHRVTLMTDDTSFLWNSSASQRITWLKNMALREHIQK